jgi:hypothetical protein
MQHFVKFIEFRRAIGAIMQAAKVVEGSIKKQTSVIMGELSANSS